MKKLKIGLDLDNTLITTDIVRLSAKYLNLKFSEQDIRDWEFSNFPENLRTEIFKRFKDPYFMCKNAKTIPGTIEKLKEWKEKNYELAIITARDIGIRDYSSEMIRQFFPNLIDKIRFVGLGKSKKSIFEREKINIWIDDNPTDCLTSIEMGIKTFLISNKNTPYNHYIKKIDKLNIVSSIEKVFLDF